MCFPQLFPYGNNCFDDFSRIVKITRVKQVRCQLRNADRRYATNMQYLVFIVGLNEQKQILSSLSIQARTSRSKLTGILIKQLDTFYKKIIKIIIIM